MRYLFLGLVLLLGVAQAEEPLPANILAQIADPSVPVVHLPPGRFAWNAPGTAITISRSDLRLVGHGTTLVQQSPGQGTFLTVVPNRKVDPWREGHLIGAISPTTDELLIGETDAPNVRTLVPGETILLRAGVSSHDPAEPEIQQYMTVKEVSNGRVKFTMPIGRALRIWDSYAQLDEASGGYWDYKIGPWGRPDGWLQQRGLGFDHGFVQFEHNRPVENVSIEGLTFEWDAARPAIYGASTAIATFSRNVHFRDIVVKNPRGVCVHMWASTNSGVDGMRTTGDGDNNIYNLSGLHYSAIAFALWGGTDCYARNVNVEGKNMVLLNCEVGSENTLVERCQVRTSFEPGVAGNTQFGVHGEHPGFRIHDIRLDIPATGNALLFASTNPGGLQFKDLAFEGTSIPDWMILSYYKWQGTIRVGNRVFGPFRRKSFRHTVTMADGNTQQLPIPPGLISRIVLNFDSLAGVRAITSPNLVWAPPQPEQRTFTIERNGPVGVVYGDIAQHLQRVSTNTWVWLNHDAQPVRVQVDVEGYFEN